MRRIPAACGHGSGRSQQIPVFMAVPVSDTEECAEKIRSPDSFYRKSMKILLQVIEIFFSEW